MDKSQFDSICTQLLYSTSQIVSLTLFGERDMMTPVKNALFFSRFSIIDQTFPNLRFLTLTYIDYHTWCLFKTQFPPFIVTLSIYLRPPSNKMACSQMTSDTLSELLFLSPSLQRLCAKMDGFMDSNVKIRPRNSAIYSSVQYFHFDFITIDLLSLLSAAPMLHTLEGSFEMSDLKLGRIHPRLFYLQQLRIEQWAMTWTEMAALLSSFPRLAYLTVIAENVNSDMADGFAWTRLLQQIKHFQFVFRFSYNVFQQQPLNLDSFRTKFWLEEKKWFVTYDRSLNPIDCSMLYTISPSIIYYPPHERIERAVSESTISEPISFPHVHRLTINDHYLKYPFLHRYTHIKDLYLAQVTTKFPTTLKDFMNRLDTSQIMTCTIGREWSRNSSYEHIDFLRSLPRLRRLKVSLVNLRHLFLHEWPHIIRLTIENDFESRVHVLSSNDINALCHSFPYIEQLSIHLLSVTDLPQLLNRMKMTLTDIIITQPGNVNNEQFITREWIERNTELRKFHYTCAYEILISLWL
jgi:hypothetical protein